MSTPTARRRRATKKHQPIGESRTVPMTFGRDYIDNCIAHIVVVQYADGTSNAAGPFRNLAAADAYITDLPKTGEVRTSQALALSCPDFGPVPGPFLTRAVKRWPVE